MAIQSADSLKNSFLYKNILTFINDQSLRDEGVLNYIKTTFNSIPLDNSNRTLVVQAQPSQKLELYSLMMMDNIYTIYSLDQKYQEDSVKLLETICEIIVLMIKTKYNTPFLANLVSIKLCCYLPADKKVPFGFVKHQDNNTKDLFNQPLLQPNLTLYIKTFEFDEKFELKTVVFQSNTNNTHNNTTNKIGFK